MTSLNSSRGVALLEALSAMVSVVAAAVGMAEQQTMQAKTVPARITSLLSISLRCGLADKFYKE